MKRSIRSSCLLVLVSLLLSIALVSCNSSSGGFAKILCAIAGTNSAVFGAAGEGGVFIQTGNGGASFAETQVGSADFVDYQIAANGTQYLLNANGELFLRPGFDVQFRQVNFDVDTASSFGFAILSDLEAFFFLQAASGEADDRMNVVQAPKVIMFNGQSASVVDTSQQPFVTTLVPVVGRAPQLRESDGTEGPFLAGDCFTSALCLAVGAAGSIKRSVDGGMTFNTVNSPTANTLRSVSILDALNAVAVGDSGTVVRTMDGGNTWGLIDIGSVLHLNKVNFGSINPLNGIIAGDGGAFSTNDGGLSWQSIDLVANLARNFKNFFFTETSSGSIDTLNLVGDSGEITQLLNQLRRLNDLQITIEVRFTTVTDSFFEQIGVDFGDDIAGGDVANGSEEQAEDTQGQDTTVEGEAETGGEVTSDDTGTDSDSGTTGDSGTSGDAGTDVPDTPAAPIFPIVIDDSDAAFSTDCFQSNNSTQGFNGSVLFSPANAGCTATWTFSNLPPGGYRVATTWTANPDRATNANYRVFEGPTLLADTFINQELEPSGSSTDGVSFEDLATVDISGNNLTVTLTDQGADEFVLADAVRLSPLP